MPTLSETSQVDGLQANRLKPITKQTLTDQAKEALASLPTGFWLRVKEKQGTQSF